MSKNPKKQQGIALVVSLIVLMVITMLAVTGMNTARLELLMAGNLQFGEQAFQAAEAGIERRFMAENFGNNANTTETINNFTVDLTVEYLGTGPVEDAGFSLGDGDGQFQAHHFSITSQANGSAAVKNASNSIVQGLYFIGPGN